MRLSRELSPFSPLDVSKSKEFKGHVKIAFAIALSESSKSTIINIIIIYRDPTSKSSISRISSGCLHLLG
jgi:hypothetical protein